MKYRGHKEFRHDTPNVAGVLVVNLGTPAAPERRSVRRYLKQFLSDPRVVEYPRWLWWLILNGIILTIRPSRSAQAYRKIWTDDGSPLLVVSRRQVKALRRILDERYAGKVKVELGMRYGHPSIADALGRLDASTVRSLLVVPLYPQYSGSTTGSVFDEVADCLKQWRWLPAVRFINTYHDHPAYIDALAGKITEFRSRHAGSDHLVMSFHGVPKSYLLQGDPYYCQCFKTARLLAERLNLDEGQWSLVFQSRFGREEWLQPYCDQELKKMPAKGIKRIDIVCPGFSADCLETLEEINIQYRQLFLDAGGERYNYIPCLNEDEKHLAFLAELVGEHLQVPSDSGDGGGGSKARAKSMGAPM